MTDQPKLIPSWNEAYANRQPNELEQRLAAQKQPWYLPEGSFGTWALEGALRVLKVSDPVKYQRIKAAQINHEDVDIAAILRGEA